MRSPTRCPGSTATFPPRRTFRRRRSAVQPSDDAWNLLNRLAKVYISPDAEVPGGEGSWLHRALLRRAHRRRWSLGIELALNSGHLTAKPSALTRSAQPALGALNDSCVAIASPKGHARPFPEHPILERAEGTTEPLEWQASGRRASSGLYCWPWRSEAPESLGSKLAPGHALGAVSPSRPFASCILSM